MKIGIAYDTKEMYNCNDVLHYDFAEEISIRSIKKELEKLGHQVTLLGNSSRIMQLIKDNQMNYDIIYNTVEGIGSRNREGIIPVLLDVNNIPYIGTDSFGLSLTLNKVVMKILAKHYEIRTPDWRYITFPLQIDIPTELQGLKFPVILKPNFEGNSSGIYKCDDILSAESTIKKLLDKYQTDILVEQFIFGQEITVPYIDCTPEPIWDITTVDVQKTPDFWLDTNWKLNGDYKNIIIELDKNTKKIFQDIVYKLFKIIGCRDFCRFDFRLTENNEIYFIEANPLPALFYGGSFQVVGEKWGLTYCEVLELIIQTAYSRYTIPKI